MLPNLASKISFCMATVSREKLQALPGDLLMIPILSRNAYDTGTRIGVSDTENPLRYHPARSKLHTIDFTNPIRPS